MNKQVTWLKHRISEVNSQIDSGAIAPQALYDWQSYLDRLKEKLKDYDKKVCPTCGGSGYIV